MKSSNGRVEGAWDAPVTNITTSNGLIDGDFTVYKSLALSTSNLGINANVALKKSDAFDVRAKTSNGKVNLLYTEQPKGSNLTSDVWTSNLGAVVLHDPQFEGAFSVRLPDRCCSPRTFNPLRSRRLPPPTCRRRSLGRLPKRIPRSRTGLVRSTFTLRVKARPGRYGGAARRGTAIRTARAGGRRRSGRPTPVSRSSSFNLASSPRSPFPPHPHYLSPSFYLFVAPYFL